VDHRGKALCRGAVAGAGSVDQSHAGADLIPASHAW
jgi:hypothetical protein